MARFRRNFSLASLFICIFVLIFTIGITVLEYFDLFTDNLYNWSNNISQWPSKINWFYFTKLIWNEKLANVGDAFILFIIPLFLFWLLVLLIAVCIEVILSVIILIITYLLVFITWLFSTLFALLFLLAVFVLGIVATIKCHKRDYTIINKIICYLTNTLSLISTILFFVIAFAH